jgi:hypothetical protein
MVGDVLIVHQADDPNESPLRLVADEVIAFFEPAKKKPTTRPLTQPSSRPAAAPGPVALELKSLEATGHVQVDRGTQQLIASAIDFDPITHWMRARGTQWNPAAFNDSSRAQDSGTADEIWWNSQTWHHKFVNGTGRVVK